MSSPRNAGRGYQPTNHCQSLRWLTTFSSPDMYFALTLHSLWNQCCAPRHDITAPRTAKNAKGQQHLETL
jgi:hypothetical protein